MKSCSKPFRSMRLFFHVSFFVCFTSPCTVRSLSSTEEPRHVHSSAGMKITNEFTRL